MPYKSEQIKIVGTEFDRRIKLSEADKQLIVWIHQHENLSQRELAALFKVSRSTIRFVLMPEKLAKNVALRLERGGWSQYYDKEKQSKTIKEHRQYKQDLKIKGLI